MIDAFMMPFMQRALIAGILIGLIASYFGVFIVQRRMSFLGDGLSHAAFGGIALGLLLRTEPLWLAVPFTILVALAITYLKEKTELGADTSIGIFFAVSVALGIIFISLKREYSVDVFSYLFGSILSVMSGDLWIAAILGVLTLLTLFLFWRRWAYATFDSELAKADKIKVLRDDFILSVFLAVTVVVSVKIVGIILIAAFLVIPAASARLVSSTFGIMTMLSVIFGVFSSIAGLIISYVFDIPSGATIILVQAFIFIVCTFLKFMTNR